MFHIPKKTPKKKTGEGGDEKPRCLPVAASTLETAGADAGLLDIDARAVRVMARGLNHLASANNDCDVGDGRSAIAVEDEVHLSSWK